MANRFLSNITINDQYTFPSTDGSAGQAIVTDGLGELSFTDIVATEADKALSLTLRVKNTESVALTKGQVVCAAPSATPPSGNVIEVKLADNNGTDSMPAIGILNEGLDAAGGANDEGEAIMFGRISGIDTSAFSVGDEVFVSDTAGALTATKPTGVKYIQKVGVIMRDDASNGTIEVFGAGRTNDVPTPLYIDHANQRVGIGIESPRYKLDVDGGAQFNTNTGATPFYITRLGSPAESLKIYTSDGGSVFETTQDETTGTYGSMAFRLDAGAPSPVFSFEYGSTVRTVIEGGTGNVGIGTTSPAHKLDVAGNVKISSGGLAIENTLSHGYVALPGGAFYHSTSTTETGAIKITLPTHGKADMLSFVVDIFDYTTNESFTVNIKGYLYQTTGNNEWVNVSAQTIASNINRNFTIRFGADGSNNCVWIGETNSSWSYPQIQVRDFTAGFDADIDSYIDGWDVDIVTSFDTVDETYFSPFPMSKEVYDSGIHLRGSGSSYFNGGNVGVGTSSPSDKLHVANGNILVNGGGIRQINLESSNSEVRFGLKGNNGNQFKFVSDGTHTKLNDAGKERIKITNAGDITFGGRDSGGNQATWMTLKDQTGNIGIGTTSPSHPLSVFANPSDGQIAKYKRTSDSGAWLELENNVGGFGLGTSGTEFYVYDRNNSSYRLVINSSGNIGIGTTSPVRKLQVEGGDFYTNDKSDTVGANVGYGGNSFQIRNGSTSEDLNFDIFNRSTLTWGTPVVIKNTGNVGIGTTSPSEALHVVGNGIFTGEATIGDKLYLTNVSSSGADGILAFDSTDTTGGSRIFSFTRGSGNSLKYHSYGYHLWQSGAAGGTSDSTNRMILDSSGRLGIGTTSPNATLSVAGTTQLAGEVSLPSTGTATASTNYPSQTLRFTTSAWDTNHATARDVDWNIRNEGASTIFADGTLTFYEEDPSYDHWKLKLPGRGSGASYIHPDAALFNGRINIYESDTSNINISLHPGGDSYFNGGKVGIGTITPDNKFHVVAGADGEVAQFTGAIENRGLSIRSETNVDASALTVFNSQSGGSKGTFAFETDGSERMRITSDGNVGIGTTSPQEELHITSTVPVIRLEDTDGGYAQIVGSNGSLSLRSDQANTVASSIIDFIIDNSEKMRIDSSGNVGIGTPSPGTKLDVISEGTAIGTTGYYYNARFTDTSNVGVMIGHNNVANGNGMIAGINKLAFLTYGTSWGERMIIDGSGNVGIGTPSPSRKLSVAGAIELTVADTTLHTAHAAIRRGNAGEMFLDAPGDITVTIDTNNNNTDRVFNVRKDTGTELFRVQENGNVGIGTTSPTEKLHVNGNILVDSVLLSNQENTDVDSAAAEMVAQVAIATYTAVFFDFVIKKGTNVRSGTVYACHDGTNVEFTETSTQDLGDTLDVTLSVDISGGNIRLVATVTSDDWSIKTLVRAI